MKSFEETMSVISKKDGDKSKIKAYIFALPEFEDAYLMNKELHRLKIDSMVKCGTSGPRINSPVEFLYGTDEEGYEGTRKFNSFNEILECIDAFVEIGYEGAMFRSPAIPYDWKRSNALMKGKRFDTITLKITGWKEGTGKYKGMMGAVSCYGFDNEGREIECDVGSGWSDEDREMFNDNYIGKMIDVRYQEITKSKDSEIYSLRFPTFDRFRLDVKEE